MDDVFMPDDVFYHLMTFLNPSDCMSLSLSGVSKRFTSFYSKREWNLSRVYCLKPTVCQQFFSSSSVSKTVEVLDLSHCYWLPRDTLLGFLTKLSNLHELYLIDTEISLVSFILNILPHCPYIVKLSVNILEPTWEEFQSKLENAPRNYQDYFKRFTDLKFCILDSSSPYIWILLFNIFGWCKDCIHLDLELFQSSMLRQDCPWEHHDSTAAVMDFARKKLFPTMSWMVSLKSLSVRSRLSDSCLNDFCRWLIEEQNPTLNELWLPSISKANIQFPDTNAISQMTKLSLGYVRTQLCPIRFPHLTHLAGVSVPVGFEFPQLRFLRGTFTTHSALDEFCQRHPQLEHLHLDGYESNGSCREERITFQCQWALARLRTLVLASNNPHPDVLKKFMDSCNVLEELHVGRLSSSDIFLAQQPVHEAYRCISKQTQLRKLVFSGLEFTHGTFLQQVFQSCVRLESLHIAGQFEDNVTFHQDLCRYLPMAKNLQHLRIQRDEFCESVLMELIAAIGCCPSLQRLVIYQEAWSRLTSSSTLCDRLMDLFMRLPRLLLFCFVYSLNDEIIEKLTRELNKSIVQSRPSFWFYLGDSLPRGVSVPRVHLDEMIDPHQYLESFPVPH